MSHSERPILFLDVDGVINCLRATTPGEDLDVLCDDGISSLTIPIRVPAGTAERLRALEAAFEIVWATAWFAGANAILPLLGIERSWPVLEWRSLKLEAIPRFAGERRWAFVDDDLSFELRQLAGNGRPWQGTGRELLVEVDPSVGLDDSALAQLLDFAPGLTRR